MCIMKAEKELGSFVLDLFIFGATHDQFPITNEMSVPDYLSVYLLKVSKSKKAIFLETPLTKKGPKNFGGFLP